MSHSPHPEKSHPLVGRDSQGPLEGGVSGPLWFKSPVSQPLVHNLPSHWAEGSREVSS